MLLPEDGWEDILLLTMSNISFPLIVFKFHLACALLLAGPWACADETSVRAIVLSLHAPQAVSVEVAGDFNQWVSGATTLDGPDEKGMWSVTLRLPINVTRIEYFYQIDGTLRKTDPRQPIIKDEFAGQNNVLFLP